MRFSATNHVQAQARPSARAAPAWLCVLAPPPLGSGHHWHCTTSDIRTLPRMRGALPSDSPDRPTAPEGKTEYRLSTANGLSQGFRQKISSITTVCSFSIRGDNNGGQAILGHTRHCRPAGRASMDDTTYPHSVHVYNRMGANAQTNHHHPHASGSEYSLCDAQRG